MEDGAEAGKRLSAKGGAGAGGGRPAEGGAEALAAKAAAASPFFSCFDLDLLPRQIVEASRGESFAEMASSNVVLVCRGAFEVLSVASDASEVLLTVLRKGDCFGVNSLYLDDPALGTSIRCLRKGTLLLVSREGLRRRMAASPKILEDYARLCDIKIHFLLERIRELTVRSSEERLLSYLRGRAGEDGFVVLDRSKEALAKMLNMSRAALFSAFSGLRERGLARCDGKVAQLLEKNSAMIDAKEGKL